MPHIFNQALGPKYSVSIRKTLKMRLWLICTSLHQALHTLSYRGRVRKASNVDTTGERVPPQFGFCVMFIY